MRNNFLFRIPGQDGMYDFASVKKMNLPNYKKAQVYELKDNNHSRQVGKMSISTILSKFG